MREVTSRGQLLGPKPTETLPTPSGVRTALPSTEIDLCLVPWTPCIACYFLPVGSASIHPSGPSCWCTALPLVYLGCSLCGALGTHPSLTSYWSVWSRHTDFTCLSSFSPSQWGSCMGSLNALSAEARPPLRWFPLGFLGSWSNITAWMACRPSFCCHCAKVYQLCLQESCCIIRFSSSHLLCRFLAGIIISCPAHHFSVPTCFSHFYCVVLTVGTIMLGARCNELILLACSLRDSCD